MAHRWKATALGSTLILSTIVDGPGAAAQLTSTPAPSSTKSTPQSTITSTDRPAATLAETLARDPATAPFRIEVAFRDGGVTLRGRVGSSYAHDVAVRTAIAMGYRVRDDLVIDTAAGYRSVGWASAGPLGYPAPLDPEGGVVATWPQPLLPGPLDPFLGLEPPLVSFPPWWGEMSRHRLAADQPIARDGGETVVPVNTVEMTIDPLGVGLLRGSVPTDAERYEVGQKLAQTPGVTRIINRLTVSGVPAKTKPPASSRLDDRPPPPPVPGGVTSADAPAGRAIRPADADSSVPSFDAVEPAPATASPVTTRNDASNRLDRAMRAKPALADSEVRVSVKDGVATLTGNVPTVLEAMAAYREAEKTPGVDRVVDSLRFVVPDGTTPNPLKSANPDDVESYLKAQVRRQVGDAAHVDKVRFDGSNLVIIGILAHADDRNRVEAILRSMPVLRGFSLLPEFQAPESR